MPSPSSSQGWKKTISYATRSKRVLAQAALGILLIGLVAGVVAGRFRHPDPENVIDRILARAGLPIEHDEEELDKLAFVDESDGATTSVLPALEKEIADPAVDFTDVLGGIPSLAPYVRRSERDALRSLLTRRFDAAAATLAVDYLAALNLDDHASYDRLEALATSREPRRYANYALGRVELRRKNYSAAVRFFEREGLRPEASESRYRVIETLLKAKDFVRLDALKKDARYAKSFTPYLRLKLAAGTHDWPTLLRLSPIVQFSGYTGPAIAMSLIAGLAWAFFLGHLGEWPRFFSSAAVLALVATVCGIASTIPTLYAVTWQEDMLNVSAGEEPVRILLYYVAGVGVREELCKLLLFLPLLPVLLKRDDDFDALIIASFVGLGFAIEENANYFLASEGTVAAGRFLTANFFHIALTGVNGLALYRAFRWGVRGLNEFLWVFPLSIAAHGAYDALQDMPNFDAGGYAAMIVFVGFCYLYFNRAHALRSERRMIVGLTGAFVLGVSLVAASLLAYEIAILGLAAGTTIVCSELLGSAVLVIMFLRVFNEPLSA